MIDIKNLDSFELNICWLFIYSAVVYPVVVLIWRISTKEISLFDEMDELLHVIVMTIYGYAMHFNMLKEYRMGHNDHEILILIAMLSFLSNRIVFLRYVRGPRFSYDTKKNAYKDRVCIVTGANSGIGLETCRELLLLGFHVILCCRSEEKAEKTIKEIESKVPLELKKKDQVGRMEFISPIDLCSFQSIKNFVKIFKKKKLKLHLLINNAGVMLPTRRTTEDNVEATMSANHFGHFLLTMLLLPVMEKTCILDEDVRILNVSSSIHKLPQELDLDKIMSEEDYSLFLAYGKSKLSNVLFTVELQNKLKASQSKITTNALHPGNVLTDVTRHLPLWLRIAHRLAHPFVIMLQKSRNVGAWTTLHLALAPELKDKGGEYYFHCRQAPRSKLTRNKSLATGLWNISEKITGIKYPLK